MDRKRKRKRRRRPATLTDREKSDGENNRQCVYKSRVTLKGSGSFRLWVVPAGSFRPGSFRQILEVGCFGLGRWVVSANFRGGLFRPW